jgi:hypothetical protein
MRVSSSRWSVLMVVFVGHDAFATQAADEVSQSHPQLTPLGFQLAAENEYALASRRETIKKQRLDALRLRLEEARSRSDVGAVRLLEGVIERVLAGLPSIKTRVSAWGSEHVAHLRAADQWKKYGSQLEQPAVIEEFDKHAQRIARLRRVREVLQDTSPSNEREGLLSQVETTIELEAMRHEEILEKLLHPMQGASP